VIEAAASKWVQGPIVTLRRDWKSRGFFRLSSVVDGLRNVAWPRLGAHRSGGGKARNQCLHSGFLFPGRCHARSGFHALRKGMNGPQLAVGVLGSRNTRLFRGLILGNIPTRLEAFPALFCDDVTLPKAVDWLPVPSHVEIADTLGNAVTFLRLALRQTTRTLFSSQGTEESIPHNTREMQVLCGIIAVWTKKNDFSRSASLRNFLRRCGLLPNSIHVHSLEKCSSHCRSMQQNTNLNRKERARAKALRETRLTAGAGSPAACGGFSVTLGAAAGVGLGLLLHGG
jgi:hypothetical protein